jgi:hypothetical protein
MFQRPVLLVEMARNGRFKWDGFSIGRAQAQ